ncbi:unnamed protein product [Trifolium pratense]|uniref:Uncharacterized protein n=1 Tax=Trifolium pratense TaxID=57577 RepID=A0ACB0LPL9_TRIPR|nr:unnamed protein product [Trifolium pratense]
MAFSIYQSFICLFLCIALILPSGLAIGSIPKFQCIEHCNNVSNCNQYCGAKGFNRGGICMYPQNQNLCCCYSIPPASSP